MVCAAVLVELVENTASGEPDDARILEINSAYERFTGISRDRAVGDTLRGLWPQTEDGWFEAARQVLRTGQPVEVEGFHKELGKYFMMSIFPVGDDRLGATFIDITARKRSEQKLDRANRDLEIVVRERSSELRQTHLDLQQEVEARANAQWALGEKSRELEARLAELAETNAALQVLLKQRDGERLRLQENLLCNINELIRPQLAKLAAGNLSKHQRALLESIETSLTDIASPLARRFAIETGRLTPTQTRVAAYIRQGRSTKEIADLMGVETSTVDYHRLQIRHRLGLTNKRVNLQTYLNSFTE